MDMVVDQLPTVQERMVQDLPKVGYKADHKVAPKVLLALGQLEEELQPEEKVAQLERCSTLGDNHKDLTLLVNTFAHYSCKYSNSFTSELGIRPEVAYAPGR